LSIPGYRIWNLAPVAAPKAVLCDLVEKAEVLEPHRGFEGADSAFDGGFDGANRALYLLVD
jgi:hypothetical protein